MAGRVGMFARQVRSRINQIRLRSGEVAKSSEGELDTRFRPFGYKNYGNWRNAFMYNVQFTNPSPPITPVPFWDKCLSFGLVLAFAFSYPAYLLWNIDYYTQHAKFVEEKKEQHAEAIEWRKKDRAKMVPRDKVPEMRENYIKHLEEQHAARSRD